MHNMLVCFHKNNDYQYHCFTGCSSIISFVHDPLFRKFMNKDYQWTSIPLPDELVFQLDFFTFSEVKE